MTHKNILLPLILASLVFTAINTAIASPADEIAALEQENTRNETVGFLGGAVLGGIIAGPPGAIGAAMLGLISSSTHSEQSEKQLLSQHLDQSQQQVIALQTQQRDLERRYQLAMQELESTNLQRVSLDNQISDMEAALACCSDTALSLHFTTNSAQIEQHYLSYLEQLAALVDKVESPIIAISGYADSRGNSSNNQRLSQQRVDAVVSFLRSKGVNPEFIHTSAYGESRPLAQEDDIEALFFDRRVNIELRSANNELLTLSE